MDFTAWLIYNTQKLRNGLKQLKKKCSFPSSYIFCIKNHVKKIAKMNLPLSFSSQVSRCHCTKHPEEFISLLCMKNNEYSFSICK